MSKSTKKNYYNKKAISKYLSQNLSLMLINGTESTLKKAYWRSFYCTHHWQYDHYLEILTTKHCKTRWCYTCNKNRMGELIRGYGEQLSQFKDPQFVTLTAKTVLAKDLPQRLEDMQDIWRKITKKATTISQIQISGLRKLECHATYDNKYHAHYHLIIEGKETAEYIVKDWLKRWAKKYPSQYTSIKAQDIRKADKNAMIELFKYATKLTVKAPKNGTMKTQNKQGIIYRVSPKQLDTIFLALKNKRVYQPIGKIKKVIESDHDFNEENKLPQNLKGLQFIWNAQQNNWESELGEWLANIKESDFTETSPVQTMKQYSILHQSTDEIEIK